MAAHFLPELSSSYAQSQFGAGSMLFGIALRDHDTAAQDLRDANAALRELLGQIDEALAQIRGDAAAAGHAAIAAVPPAAPDVRLSSLRAEFDGLRQAFCALAPLIEPAGDDPGLAPLASARAKAYAWFSTDARRRSVPLLNN
jgi:hypothetical protein